MGTDARERLCKILERVDETRDSARPYFVDQEFAEAARALLAEPPAGDAALLHQINGVLRWVEGLLGSNIEAVLIADELRHAIARAATPAAAEPEPARDALREALEHVKRTQEANESLMETLLPHSGEATKEYVAAAARRDVCLGIAGHINWMLHRHEPRGVPQCAPQDEGNTRGRSS